jgi:diadenosine hexaphosphate hydrolase (ATP-forming)
MMNLDEAGTVAFVDDLVALRHTNRGEWILPKGHIEPGEDPAVAALRELEEETGLLGSEPIYVGTDQFSMDGQLVRVAYFAVTAIPGPHWPEHENKDAWLCAPEEAMARLSFEGVKRILRLALEARRSQSVTSPITGQEE